MWLLSLAIVVLIVLVYKLRSKKSPPISMNGIHVLITGGSSGIGKSVAKYLAEKDSKITLFARDVAKLDQAKFEIEALIQASGSSTEIQCISVDISKEFKEVENAVKTAVEAFGPVRIVINCAGTSMSAKVEDTKIEEYRKMMDVNYFGTVNVTKACIPYMKETGGRIVITSSLAGLMGLYGYTAYAASKFALRGFAECLQMELKPYNIFVTLNCPPDTDTPGFAEEEKMKPQITRSISESGGLVSPDVVAKGLVEDMFEGKFLSTTGFEGNLLHTACAGMSPVTSLRQLLWEVHAMGIVRLIAFFTLRNFDGIVNIGLRREKEAKESQKID